MWSRQELEAKVFSADSGLVVRRRCSGASTMGRRQRSRWRPHLQRAPHAQGGCSGDRIRRDCYRGCRCRPGRVATKN